MTTQQLFEKLMYNVNRATNEGASIPEVIGILECIKHGLANTVVKTGEQPQVVPVKVLHDGFGRGEGPR